MEFNRKIISSIYRWYCKLLINKHLNNKPILENTSLKTHQIFTVSFDLTSD